MATALSTQSTEAATDPATPPYALPAEELLAYHHISVSDGLDDAAVAAACTIYGPNELQEAPTEPLWRKFVGQFTEVVIVILIVAAVISGLLGEWSDAVAILAIVILNGVLGFLQEQRAERALAALQKMSAPQAKVIRNGALVVLPARDLVPGDVIQVEAGDNVPADVRLIDAYALRIQEATLTGESLPVEKDAQCVIGEKTPLADRRNMGFMGTVVAAGKASALVVATGMRTELGRIAGMLQRAEPEPTPLQKRLAELGRFLAYACLVIVAVVFVLELLEGGNLFEVFLLSVSLAVAAVPEGLPAVVTIALALGLQRMIRRNALIRRLPSVETLGSVTVICSDKTGTLTKNEMTVREVYANSIFEVTGAGYTPRGQFSAARDGNTPVVKITDEPDLVMALTIGVHCNNARLQPQGATGAWQVIGDPTEGALLVVGAKAGIPANGPELQVISEIPFDSDRKAMSVVLHEPTGKIVMYTKGAPEVLLSKCVAERRLGRVEPLTEDRRREILKVSAGMASRALRVLAVAYREDPEAHPNYDESGLVFAGLMGMIDPPRDEVKAAVQTCHQAGIRPIMITGDHPATALAIARELGIARGSDGVVTGQELNDLTDQELAARVDSISVYARVAPEHKLCIVRAWKARGQVVAMTGDGVNDAPAIKAADIGIAMGLTGTDVTKEASAMVLTDDNFTSIVSAVEEGRGIYDNIQKVLTYLLSCNLGEILLVLLASLLGWPAPLIPVQLLWINLVTDGLPALALALEPPEPGIMRRKPRPPQESILSWGGGLTLLLQGTLVGGSALTAFGIAYLAHPEDIGRARTIAFCVLVYGELFRALAARSATLPLFKLGLTTNLYLLAAVGISALLQLSIILLPFVRPLFEAHTHSAGEWALLISLAFVPFTVMELLKWARSRFLRGET